MARILIVDDEPGLVTVLQGMLEKDGHSVSTAGSGTQALAMLGVQPPNPKASLPDLILLDVMMPRLNGQETCLRLAASEHAKAVPVVMLTGKNNILVGLAEMPNVVACVSKPCEPATIRKVLEKTLPKKSRA